jgi:hypothetical protein
MGVPISEVGYTTAMPRREDHVVHKDKKKYIYTYLFFNKYEYWVF